MSLAKSITDRGSCVCWCPFESHRQHLALGTKESIGANGFDDYGGRLEVYYLDFAGGVQGEPKLLASVETTQRFGSIAWGPHKSLPMGIICGGMTDGKIKFWDAQKLIEGNGGELDAAHLVDCAAHTREVKALAFNPHPNMSHILATGGADNSVFIIDLSNPLTPKPVLPATMDRPGQTSFHNAAVNTLAWNPQVAHILASAADDGACIVWDLKNNKTFCTLQHPLRLRYSDVAWNPNEGFQIITSIADDSKPFLQVWDLRKSTTAPFKELKGHTRAILNIAWNKSDTNILASCSEDGKTLIWDLFLGKPISEVQTPHKEGEEKVSEVPKEPQMSANELFAFGDSTPRALTGEGDRRNNAVAWAPHVPGVLACCTFDKKVNIFSLHGIGGQKPPKYMRRPAGAAFGFGGKLAEFKISEERGAKPAVTLQAHSSDPATVAKAKAYLESVSAVGKRELCLAKAANQELSESTRRVWSFLALFFSDGSPDYDARQYLQSLLGFEKSKINSLIAATTGKTKPSLEKTMSNELSNIGGIKTDDTAAEEVAKTEATYTSAEDFFGAAPADDVANVVAAPAEATTTATMTTTALEKVQPTIPSTKSIPQIVEAPGDDRLLLDALLVGNFEGVVDVCLTHGRMSDALMFAFASTQEELWQRAQDAYLAQQQKIRTHTMRVVSAIVKSEFLDLVNQSKPEQWRETLTVLVTFSKKDNFQKLSELLGDHLSRHSKYLHAAGLCYLCASNASKTLAVWQSEMTEVAAVHGRNAALQELIERIHVFASAPENNAQKFGTGLGATFTAYANFLADDGELETATKYLEILPQCAESQELRERMAQALTKRPQQQVQQQQSHSQQSHNGHGLQQHGNQQNTNARWQTQTGTQQHMRYRQSQVPQHEQYNQATRYGQTNQPVHSNAPAYGSQSHAGQYSQQPQPSVQRNPYQQVPQRTHTSSSQHTSHGGHQHPSHNFGSPVPQHNYGSTPQHTTFNPATANRQAAPAPAPAPTPAPMYSNPYEAGTYANQPAPHQRANPHQLSHSDQQGRVPQPLAGRPTPGKHMPDGFGSTHAAARSYVEQATASQSPASPPAAEPVKEAGPITNSLQILCARLKSSNLRPAEEIQFRTIDDSVKKLIKMLSSGEIQDRDVVAALVELCASFDRNDWANAARQTASMARNFYKGHRSWLKGFKFLGTLCKTKFANGM